MKMSVSNNAIYAFQLNPTVWIICFCWLDLGNVSSTHCFGEHTWLQKTDRYWCVISAAIKDYAQIWFGKKKYTSKNAFSIAIAKCCTVICRRIQILHFLRNKVRHGAMSWKVTTQENQIVQDMERNNKAVRKKQKEHTHTPFELTSLLHCRNRASYVKHATEQKTVPQRVANKVRGTKTCQSAFVQKNLSCSAVSSVGSVL